MDKFQSPLNKLSIGFLADAITRIEITESIPFAVIGTNEAIATLRKVYKRIEYIEL